MVAFNSVVVAGVLVSDPETSPAGTSVVLRIERSARDGDGGKRTEVLFVRIVLHGRTAETVARFARAGGGLLVHGRLVEDGDGRMHVEANAVQFLVGKGEAAMP